MRIWLLALFCILAGCDGKPKLQGDKLPAEKSAVPDVPSAKAGPSSLLHRIPCHADNQISYSVYFPAAFNEFTSFPVLLLFDPHADADLPLNLYKGLADKYHIILVSSCDSKNGNTAEYTAAILQTLMAEIPYIEKADTALIFSGGFSGGARVAAMLGLSPAGIAAVISSGAGLPEGSWQGVPPHLVVAIAGDRDMNLREVLRFKSPDSRIQTRYQIVRFAGEHAWPPVETMEQALIACLCIAQRDHLTKENRLLLENAMREMRRYIAKERNPLFKREAYFCFLKNFKDLADVKTELQEMNQLEQSHAFQQMQKEEKNLFAEEDLIRNNYNQAIGTRDTIWWEQQLSALLDTAKYSGQTQRLAMLKRVQGNFSLVFYMSLNRAIKALEKDQQLYFSALYRKVDPQNPEAWYLAAVVSANLGSLGSAKDYLRTAFKTGFKDTGRCKSEPAFSSILSDYGFQSIINQTTN